MLDDIESMPGKNSDSSNIIEITSPRRTLLLSTTPTIRWYQVPEANYYTVSLLNGSETCWQQLVSGTEIVYPGNPPLEPGVLYSIAIKSDNNFSSSSDLEQPDLKFMLLDSISAQKIESRIEQIRKLKLEPKVEALALTVFYIECGLNTEAIETLEQLIFDGTQVSMVYQTLSKLYQYVGLDVLSQARSQTASELESACDAKESDRLEQEVTKVLELQSATKPYTEQAKVNVLEQKIAVEAVAIENQQFVVCAVGQPCSTPTVPSGIWTYSLRSGCYCRPVSPG